ncbi:2-isopropylmalate synthase [Coniophora puteana RWD-64-598 SS2]|uniref:2-isopropylmalate synthase n=1 Tax=Coniophora puteana (strain RWD-64-598) TaxID=741705 RepID=A0A5M3MKZ0_CONPW|nr:2-isopropylmalate synthase [Coniophora puteana RWD-64-598 SS2]EIW79909.1 2-isopropylmalate synthase [Coniophora puteana RWD-64-598 SS2]
MPMLKDPSEKYDGYEPIDIPDRTWPTQVTRKAPIWLSTDLRDGNQALQTPMNVEQKLELFDLLVSVGFKEIEVAFPPASETEFTFVRRLIEEKRIPDGVAIQVMTPARRDCISRTFDAIRGAKRVIVQLYNATAPIFRDIVFQSTKEDIIKLAVEHTHVVRALAIEYERIYGTVFQLCYGIEGFTQSEPDFVIDVCSRIKDAWDSHGPSPTKIIFNLPSTVECAPANHFADQVEYFCRNIPKREEVLVCLHAHNDRGTAVSATELGLLAGADRVDGCLLGNGERTGNVDLIILALNLYTQGIPPHLDFSDLGKIVESISRLTALPVHPRHPYSGSLVFTAFSGGHQDGIRKGLVRRAENPAQKWRVPYLPVDPSDFGFVYRPVRINSQSGRGGITYLLEQAFRFTIPRPMQADFYKTVQNMCDTEGRELAVSEIIAAFCHKYHFSPPAKVEELDRPVEIASRVALDSFTTFQEGPDEPVRFEGTLSVDHRDDAVCGRADEVHSAIGYALARTLAVEFVVMAKYIEPLAEGRGAAGYVRLGLEKETAGSQAGWWGVGVGCCIEEATARAIVSASNVALDQVSAEMGCCRKGF